MGQIACLASIVFALLPSGASAAADNCNAPPGTSGIDQYCEVLPGAGGTNGTHHKKKPATHVSPQVTQDLQRQGSAGAAILQLTQQSGAATVTTPKQTTVKRHKTRHKKKAAATTPSSSTTPPSSAADNTTRSAPANDPVSAVGNAVSVGSGVGAGFIWVMVGIGLVFGAMAWVSYRRRVHESGA